MAKKLLTFEEYVKEVGRSEEIEKEINDLGEPETLEEEDEDESEEEDEDESEEEVETEEEDEDESEEDESEEVETEEEDEESEEEDEESEEDAETEEVEAAEEIKAVSEMMTKAYEAAVKEACAYEGDDYTEHTVESYMNEMATLNAGMMTEVYERACSEVKEGEMTIEMYEAACNAMKEAYSKKMSEMMEAWASK